MKIRLASPTIQKDSIVDGEGIRAVIWTQGCIHNCLGCHNPETHDLNGGYELDIEDVKKQIDNLVGQDGITLSGGDPLEQPKACSIIAKYCQKLGLNVWCYTGYTYEILLKKAEIDKNIMELLKNIDVLVDGKFIKAEQSYDVIFRGSKNQRLIDIPKSLKTKTTVLVTKYDEEYINKKGRKNQYMYL